MQETVGIVSEGSIVEEKNNVVVDNNKIDEVMLPGFRFHPTDEELVGFYLKRKIQQRPLSIELIKQLDIYKYDPWDLPKFASAGEKEWYFYCPRDRKYRNSARPNRVTGAGFWKATGTDRPIYSSEGNKCIGLKKSLVFYKGRAAKGVKTDWMMHEFRLPSLSKTCVDIKLPANDSWAICRIFKKTSPIAPRTLTHSWISSPLPNPTPSIHTFSSNSNFNTEKYLKATCTSPMQQNSSNINDFDKSLLLTNTFTFLDDITSLNSISTTSNNYNSHNNTSTSDNLFQNITPFLDLPHNYILPQLEDPSETPKSNNIDASSMLVNMSTSVLENMEFSMLPNNVDEQCHEFSSSCLSQDQYQQQNQVNIVDDNHCDINGYYNQQDLSSTLLSNLNNAMCSEGDDQRYWDEIQNLESIPISGFLPFNIPEAWKSPSSLLWDCPPPLS